MGWKISYDNSALSKLWKNKDKEEKSIDQVITCQNCETEFKGHYCPRCGQSTKEFDRPFSILIYDFMGTIFAFDARFFRTFKTVLFNPGRFSTDYMNGKRARYMKPFQFYVFVSFVFFLLLSIQTNRLIERNIKLSEDLTSDSLTMDSLVDTGEQSLLQMNWNSDSLAQDSLKVLSKGSKRERTIITLSKAKTYLEKIQAKGGHTEGEERILQNALKMLNYPDAFISKLYKYLSWSFFLVMPIFAFWLWLFFRKKRKYYSAHFIYSLILHATIFLVFTLILVIKMTFPDKSIYWENYLFWLIPIYVWIGMKQYYGRSVLRTTFNFLFLGGVYTFSMIVTVIMVFLVSLYF
ncbi:MAG: hypothetical protein CVT99_15195 [Bacteroidetes bacterium HGW-Bacteroidetes-16]|jgi:hypothetical protein|nr:MAG: hypothetical protein CVT99_15195 [Bacteroidetes bacterium HGW-Bacteroidetes-16]